MTHTTRIAVPVRALIGVTAAAIVLLAIHAAPAAAQSVAPGASPGAASPSKMRQQPAAPGGRRPAAAAPGGNVSNLTEDECKRLGGQIYNAPNCTKTGKRCTMKLAGGDIYAPCVDE